MISPTLSDIAKYYEDPNSDQITLIRKQIVYSEIVISKSTYEEIKNKWDFEDDLSSFEELKSEMVTDECMEYIGDEQESWMMFHGDVTGCSDDLIFWTDKEWENFFYLK